MLTVICSILLGLLVLSIILLLVGCKRNKEGLIAGSAVLMAFSGISFIVMCTVLICNIATVSTAHIIDSKIQMYEEENSKIEEKITLTVENYLGHESEVFENLTPETATTILAKYPELKADELVASQISIYISNTEQLKSLKEDRIDISVKKWWVYFGR